MYRGGGPIPDVPAFRLQPNYQHFKVASADLDMAVSA
jgi:hypothetical protein